MTVEGTSYLLDFSPPTNQIAVVCPCSSRWPLSKLIDNSFYLSNLYKHWKTVKGYNILSSSTLSRSFPTPFSPILNDSSTNDDHEDQDGDDDADSNQSSTLMTHPNTRSWRKRTNPYSHSRNNEQSVRQRA